MPSKARPSLRAKTLKNVERSNLSTTDKECIKAVFERFEDTNHLKWYPPTADVVEVEHGYWKECFEDWRKQNAGDECSVCGFQHYGTSITHYNYCPNCGSRINYKVEEIKCIDCKHRMFSDMYCECSKGYKGIVQPWDGCEHGEKIEE